MIYIKPPRGEILLSELHRCVTTRINYFLYRYQQDSTITRESLDFDCLLIGTALDRTGHFMLRLLSVQSPSVKEFVASSEANFIIERLEFLSSKPIMQLIKTTLRHMDEICDSFQSDTIWKTEIKYILNEMKYVFKCSHMVDFNHNEKCTQFNLKVPFQMCLSLVAKRELLMEKGKAIVPCGKWKLFLKCLFEAHVRREISKLESSHSVTESMSDQRLQELRDIVISTLLKNSNNSSNKGSVSLNDLEKLKEVFPPCMGHLYNNLKVNHRLGHYARFNLSLFLKDIGLSLNESVVFWQNEYSKPSKCGCKCSHSWQKDSAKFTYSIRHLYGLEGKRVNYVAPSCSKIQSNKLGPSDEGGCPFLNFDLNQLQKYLNPKISREDFEMLTLLRSRNQTLKACEYYRTTLMKTANVGIRDDVMEHKTPVEYFVILRKQLNLDEDDKQ